jgi:uncharacterized integral membrane protein (TIGR00698 family)
VVRKTFYVGAGLLCCLPWCSPPMALALGLLFGMLAANPWPREASRFSRMLLKLSVVGLGFGMDPRAVLSAGRASFAYTAIGIAATMAIGIVTGRLLRVPHNSAFLISVGTAICGGSAIAAVCPILHAGEEEAAVSLSTVFVLNSIGLIVFPLLGTALHLSQTQFGLWAAMAIHDTSSVVGAGLKYGQAALIVATTVKLVRTLWIVPVALATAILFRTRARVQWPWFVLLFLVAAWLSVELPGAQLAWTAITQVAKSGFAVTLFLIGSGLNRKALGTIGWRPMALGMLLWVIASGATLLCIRARWIGF